MWNLSNGIKSADETKHHPNHSSTAIIAAPTTIHHTSQAIAAPAATAAMEYLLPGHRRAAPQGLPPGAGSLN
ncbi:hypothetical protein DL768_010373 [Monosporascus sp. mg162]|nr:hypothetical protein DL768_010373 [Monosporascus sp. mg162]